MEIIERTISLESITSRVPSIWPAYKDNKLYFFDDESLKKREYEYPTNYGMIPLSFSFSSDTFDLGCSDYTISFERLSQCYSFFRQYQYLLNNCGHCNRVYNSAVDYYNTEIETKYSSELMYGTNEETYKNLDKEYEEKGGDAFFQWISNNVIPTYEISKEYQAYWKRQYLYYSDVIQWISWLNERKSYEKSANFIHDDENIDIDHWDCKSGGVNNCCDCEEYFNRGGERELIKMKAWYNALQGKISAIDSIVLDGEGNVKHCFSPSVIEQIELKNSLENIGQYSSLSPEFENGIDYRGADNYGASKNTRSGTTIIDESGNTRILMSNGGGFCFSSFYMEKIFDEDSWGDYADFYISGNPQEFVSSGYNFYAFDDYDNFYSGNTINEVISAMSSGVSYSITHTDSILVDDVLIPIETSEYGEYDPNNVILGGRKYFVHREKNTDTPYTLINGKKIYANSYLSGSGIVYYFSFFKNSKTSATDGCHNSSKIFNIANYKIFGRRRDNDLIKYIMHNDKTYTVEDGSSGITIDDIFCYRISGYTYDDNGNIFYTMNGQVYDDLLNELPPSYKLDDNGNTLYFNVYNNDTIIYNAKEITGHTLSKLNNLASTNRLCDDIGNSINGIYNDTCRLINGEESSLSSMTYAQPPIYTVLEPLYQVGNTSLIGKFKLTQEDPSKITNDVNYFIGNIINGMEFYYKDVNGNKTSASAKCSSSVTSLSAITFVESAKTQIDNTNIDIIFDDNLYCDIEYYIGATLKRNSGTPFKLAEDYNYGVKYNETVKFVKTPTFYGLKVEPEDKEIVPTQQYDTVNLPHKYTIYTYEMVQDLTNVENDTYETIHQIPLARFTTEINLVDSNLESNFSHYQDMDKYNGVDVSPVYQEEYKLGTAMKEKVDADIYIDRGINAAFEKHLKLGEVTSLEEMTQFGNGYFKIMDA